MNLSFHIIEEELSKNFEFYNTLPAGHRAAAFQGAELYTGAAPCADLLYVTDKNHLPGKRTDGIVPGFAVAGEPDPAFLAEYGASAVCVKEENTAVLANAILCIFRKYEAFENLLKRLAMDDAPAGKICGAAAAFTELPLLVTDSMMRILYASEGAQEAFRKRDEEDGKAFRHREEQEGEVLRALPDEFVDQLALMEAGAETLSAGDAVLLDDDRLPFPVITTFFSRKPFHIFLLGNERTLTAGVLETAVLFSPYIGHAFEPVSHGARGAIGISSAVLSMLEGIKPDRTELTEQLSAVGWSMDDHYCCLVLRKQSGSSFFRNTSSVCNRIESFFSDCAAVPYKDQIAAFVNLDRSGCDMAEVSYRIAPVLREGLFKAGISFVFWEFDTAGIYYQQALGALMSGQHYRPDDWVYRFREYALYHILHYGTSRIPARYLCHPALVYLHGYDEEHDTSLLETFETYLRTGCSAAAAADRLFIHRNTFYQRFTKIRELVDVDLNDDEEKLYLMLSTSLIRMHELDVEKGFGFWERS